MWDGVPWFTEGGALHSAETARLLAYAAFGSNEGVVGARDLVVRALEQPAASVQVAPGACAILNRATGATYQAYAGRLPVPDTIPIAATGAQPRSDLIVARVENPYPAGEGWALPADPEMGPYVFTRVISGVPPTTIGRDLPTLAPRDSAIVLARIDIPANTASITQQMITDLRAIANPRQERQMRTARLGEATTLGYLDGSWQEWPGQLTTWRFDVPVWATRMSAKLSVSGFRVSGSPVAGDIRLAFAGLPGPDVPLNDDEGSGVRRRTILLSGEFPIAADLRSTTQELEVWTRLTAAGNGAVQVDQSSWLTLEVEFSETPDTELPEPAVAMGALFLESPFQEEPPEELPDLPDAGEPEMEGGV
ncbi:hypothetical protein ACIQ9R_36400 [Streptomyces sp. NPDC094447]|uniref:hypothetical protein n=1 Tax=Streptomyces sp. NPDC094447 TaxID=3366062 RepID=UPI00381AC778